MPPFWGFLTHDSGMELDFQLYPGTLFLLLCSKLESRSAHAEKVQVQSTCSVHVIDKLTVHACGVQPCSVLEVYNHEIHVILP